MRILGRMSRLEGEAVKQSQLRRCRCERVRTVDFLIPNRMTPAIYLSAN